MMSIRTILALFALFLAVANAQVRGSSKRLRLDNNNGNTLADAVVDKVKRRFLMKDGREEKEEEPEEEDKESEELSLSTSMSLSMSMSTSMSMSL